MEKNIDLRSPLKKVRGLGSAKEGGHHWLMQRFTAIALIILVSWFAVNVIKAGQSGGFSDFVGILSNPCGALLMILFIVVGIYHGCLGMKVVIEDYVRCECGKLFLLVVINFFSIVTALAAVLAIVYMHVNSYEEHGEESRYGIATCQEIAEKYSVEKRSDLEEVVSYCENISKG